MPTVKLTTRSVEASQAKEGARDTLFWDTDLRGFGLRVSTLGSKTYLVQYRMGGRGFDTRRYTIGKHGVWTAPAARIEAERLLRHAANGTDPKTAAEERERLKLEVEQAETEVARFVCTGSRSG